MTIRLEQSYVAGGAAYGGFRFRLHNLGDAELRPAKLCYASMTRLADTVRVTGGRLLTRFANHVEIAAEPGLTLAPGAAWEVAVDGLTHAPTNRTQGAMAAWIEYADGTTIAATVGDLQPPTGTRRGPLKAWPEGRTDLPICLLPWPAEIAVTAFADAAPLRPADPADARAFATVAALHRRLFPADPVPLTLDAAPGVRAVATQPGDLPPGGYRLDFGETVTLTHGDADGLRHGLIALSQMTHAARTDPRFRVPAAGYILDHPRHAWRGCHLDVARNFMEARRVARVVDILAWHRMTRLHWHLSDDEGWRLPSEAFPDLPRIGGRRGPGGALPPQYADGPEGQSGHYTAADVRALVAQAAELGLTVLPEIDMPGHMTALLAAVPGLRDAGEPWDSYRSIQGYPNNALNPGLERTYEVVETLLDELCTLFPSEVIHVGGDEVDSRSWTQSPAARALAERQGLDGTMALQAHFLRRVQAMVRDRGRTLGGWDECAEGGGVRPEGAVLFAWRTVETTARLLAEGSDVVATPGQAYYLDMVEAPGWAAAGTSWAGVSTPEACYRFEATEGLPDGPGRLRGVQAAIWTEHIDSTARFNDTVFPRLSAVAEAGWTPAGAKDWQRFAALSRLMPRL